MNQLISLRIVVDRSLIELELESKDEILEYVKKSFEMEISKYIRDLMQIRSEYDPNTHSDAYTTKLAVLLENEYKHLKEIERRFYERFAYK